MLVAFLSCCFCRPGVCFAGCPWVWVAQRRGEKHCSETGLLLLGQGAFQGLPPCQVLLEGQEGRRPQSDPWLHCEPFPSLFGFLAWQAQSSLCPLPSCQPSEVFFVACSFFYGRQLQCPPPPHCLFCLPAPGCFAPKAAAACPKPQLPCLCHRRTWSCLSRCVSSMGETVKS